MSQISISHFHPEVLPHGNNLKKSDIVVAIIGIRSGVAPSEKKILNDLSYALKHYSLNLENWDQYVDAGLTHRIIKHVASVKGQLSVEAMIQDIDIMVERLNAG